jgi:general secretion pathway protein C
MLARLMAFLVWGLLAGSGVYWLVHLLARPLPTQAAPVSEHNVAAADLSRLFGAAAASGAPLPLEPAVESRFKLLGVVAPKSARAAAAGEGVALIAVDGIARTVRVGAAVDGELRLLAVNARSAGLGREGTVSLNLQLASPAPAGTGMLAPAAPSPTILGGNVPLPPANVVPQPPPVASEPSVDARGLPTS